MLCCRSLNDTDVIQLLWGGLGIVLWAADLETGAAHDKVSSRTTAYQPGTCNADVAQLVAHHLAKVRVASSSLVIRSKTFLTSGFTLSHDWKVLINV